MGIEQKIYRPRYSYSALSLADQCLFSFYQKYILKNRVDTPTLATSAGTIAHKGKELVSQALMRGEKPDYDAIMNCVMNGHEGADKATGEMEILPGMNQLKVQFWDDWIAKDTKSGLTYEQKLALYREHLPDEERDTLWKTVGVEMHFEYEFAGVVLFGIIDKVAINPQGEVKIVDYKTSKKIFEGSDLATPLQMWIYRQAVQAMIEAGQIPGATEVVSHEYSFIFIGCSQEGGTKGWLKRGEAKLCKILQSIDKAKETGVWKPSPTPLCYWCSYCRNSPTAPASVRHECPYYSLWTPTNKVYDVALRWTEGAAAPVEQQPGAGVAAKPGFWF